MGLLEILGFRTKKTTPEDLEKTLNRINDAYQELWVYVKESEREKIIAKGETEEISIELKIYMAKQYVSDLKNIVITSKLKELNPKRKKEIIVEFEKLPVMNEIKTTNIILGITTDTKSGTKLGFEANPKEKDVIKGLEKRCKVIRELVNQIAGISS